MSFVAVAVLFASAQVQAQTVIPFDGATQSSYYPNPGWSGPAANLIDDNPATQWQSHGCSDNEGKDYTPSVTFFFDDIYNVGGVSIRNLFGGAAERGARDVDILVSLDGVKFDYYTSIVVLKDTAADKDSCMVQDFEFLGGVDAMAVMFEFKSNHWNWAFYPGHHEGTWANASIVGLVDVQFTQTVPEPAAMSLLVLGGLAMLRRKR